MSQVLLFIHYKIYIPPSNDHQRSFRISIDVPSIFLFENILNISYIILFHFIRYLMSCKIISTALLLNL